MVLNEPHLVKANIETFVKKDDKNIIYKDKNEIQHMETIEALKHRIISKERAIQALKNEIEINRDFLKASKAFDSENIKYLNKAHKVKSNMESLKRTIKDDQTRLDFIEKDYKDEMRKLYEKINNSIGLSDYTNINLKNFMDIDVSRNYEWNIKTMEENLKELQEI
jgi:hypothetical protein